MFKIIIVMLKRTSCVVGRIDIDTFDGTRIVLFESFESKQVIAMNEHIAIPRLPVGQCTRLDRTV